MKKLVVTEDPKYDSRAVISLNGDKIAIQHFQFCIFWEFNFCTLDQTR